MGQRAKPDPGCSCSGVQGRGQLTCQSDPGCSCSGVQGHGQTHLPVTVASGAAVRDVPRRVILWGLIPGGPREAGLPTG